MADTVSTRRRRTLAQAGIFAYSPTHLSLGDQGKTLNDVGGIVLPGVAGLSVANDLRSAGFKGSLLIDPARYSDATKRDDSRHSQGELFHSSIDWLEAQSALGVDTALSPSNYVDWENWRGLRKALGEGSAFCERAAKRSMGGLLVLPIDVRFLSQRIDRLAKALETVPHPIGLIVADRTNPFKTKYVLPHTIALIREFPHVAILRSDHSAIGLAAHGAMFSAVGVTSATRHLVPPGIEGGGSRGDRSPSVFVKLISDYRRGSTLERLEAIRELLVCLCSVCGGRSLTRFGDPRLKDEARRHTVATSLELAAEVLSVPTSERAAAWNAHCNKADWARAEIERESGVILRNDALTSWLRISK